MLLLLALATRPALAQIASWDFTGENTLATSAAEVYNANMDASNVLTRGPGAAASVGANSFRTVGFQNNGISTANTDYFQWTLSAATGFSLSLSTLNARCNGTTTYAAAPGVSQQYAYSLDGTNFTLIGSPLLTPAPLPVQLPQVDLTGISALQNVPASTTVTFRYYASGVTATGGWGFFSSASPNNIGLAVGGTVNLAGGCATTLGAVNTSCDALTNGIDTYDLTIAFSGLTPGITVTNAGASGTLDLSGGNPATQNSGTIIINNITEGDGYSVTFSSPCSSLGLSGNSPVCAPPPCGITLGTPSTLCDANTVGVDTYDLSIPYTGIQVGVTVSNLGASGILGGDDPALVTNGTILVSNISESDGYSVALSAPCGSLSAVGNAPVCAPLPVIIINEVDYDNVGTDNAEWVELYNAGAGPVNLAGYSIVAVNGANGAVQSTTSLSAVTLVAGDYYVVGTAAVPNVDQVVTGTDRIQNGPVDAVVLRNPSNAVVDAISYEGTSIAPFAEGTGLATGDDNTTANKVIARIPNGTDSNVNSADWAVWCASPGISNNNAPDSDLDATPDCLDGCPLAVNGISNFNATVCACNIGYDPVFTTIGPNQVITACQLSACDIILGTAVVTCNSFTPGTTDTYTVSIPYTGVEPGVGVANNGSSGTIAGDNPASVLNGTIQITNVSEADAYSISLSSPCGTQTASGAAPVCEPTPDLVINEVDYDQPGTDTQEFIEILNRGAFPVGLGGLKVVLWNGTGNTPYATVTLNSFTLAAGDYFVLGSATAPNVDQVYFTSVLTLQNGPDGVRLTTASNTVIDQMSYGTGILGSTETAPSITDLSTAGISLSRVPDGNDTNNNSVDFIRACFSPGAANTQLDDDNDGTANCVDVCPGGPEPGSACNDNNPGTGNDVVQGDCSCAGQVIDCLGQIGGAALPGEPCNDGNPLTLNDVYQLDCTCLGVFPDCLGVIGGTALPGTPCNDNDPSTNDEVYQGYELGCGCVGTPCSQNVTVELRTDANSAQAGWEILYQNDNTVVCSGGLPNAPYTNGITSPITASCCLPVGCFRLRVLDSGGDGFVSGGINGGYQLRESGFNGRRVIDNMPLNGSNNVVGNFGNLAGGPPDLSAVASIFDNGAFCLPMAANTSRPIFSSCDKLDWANYQFLVAAEDPAVTAQLLSTPAASGYEFWFFDPNGGYSYRRFRSHSTTDGFGTGATRACHFKINKNVYPPPANQMAGMEIPYNTLLNVRIRSRINGVNQPFGPACLFRIDATRAACPLVKLQDNPLNVSDFSCGVTRTFGGASSPSNRIVANPPQFSPAPLAGGTGLRYQFRFRIPGEAVCIVRPPQTSPTMVMNWTTGTQLQCGKTYLVDVRVSKDLGATWCVDAPSPSCSEPAAPWGKVCSVLINTSTFCPSFTGGSSSLAQQGTNGDLTMYPNPNRGDQVFLSLSEVSADVRTVTVDIYDLSGKRVVARTIAVQASSSRSGGDGYLNTFMELNGDLAGGMYLVNITAGDKTYTERLVIQP